MTTKTGATAMKGLPDGPPLIAALFGAGLQLGTLGYTWRYHTSAEACLSSPIQCAFDSKADPFGRSILFVLFLTSSMWIVSLRSLPSTGTSDPSIVDRLWSIMPWIYVWYWCICSGFKLRLCIMAGLSSFWGVRLTYNFWRKGGFSGGEDYRWAVVRKWYPGWKWELFNLIFICFFQQTCVFAFTVPAVAALQSDAPLNSLDAVSAVVYLLLVLGETIADNQIYQFQTEKYRRVSAGEDLGPYSSGFIQSGLWAYSRHPNYFCEVTMWWAFYGFSVAASGKALNWTILGVVFLCGLFLPPGASVDVTESISLTKYSSYPEYQQRVSRFVPWFPRHAVSKRD
eukprot:TRINITY_DN65965_c0_g1_i1.p1 TRINITY_DN65965_c0_g1~~TRINITY_DN65965_c0_g1_i1.p1  ORF type:complete len:341 (+),score=14.18 TRINITY_DN65965_c0_g1_i1:47-1069(+)